jgi:hypothetical protein
MARKQSSDKQKKNRKPRQEMRLGGFNVALPGGLKVGGTGVIGLLLAVIIGGWIILSDTGKLAAAVIHAEPVQTPVPTATRLCLQPAMISVVSLHRHGPVEPSTATPLASMAER